MSVVDQHKTSRGVSGTPARQVARVMLFVSLLAGLWAPVPTAAWQQVGLRVVVIEGQDRFNIIGQGTPAPTVVEVRDGNDDPASGASVVFRLLEGGRSTLNAGLQEVELTTNAMGRASVTVNPLAGGEVDLSVVATFGAETATASILQTNLGTAAVEAPDAEAAPEVEAVPEVETVPDISDTEVDAGGGPGVGMILGLVGAAGAAAVLALASGGDDSAATSAPSPAPTPSPRPAPPPAPDPAETNRAALIEFYNATGGARWNNNRNWNSDAPLSAWFGVSADTNGRVTVLDLRGNGLAGSIPSSLENLTNLEQLHLYGNDLTGLIPSSLGNFANLKHLNLSFNELTGSIPSSLGSLTNLEYLYLSRNELTGSIPSSLGSLTDLRTFWLDDNALTGPLPSSLGDLTNLETLSVPGNELTGSIPSSLGNLNRLQLLRLNRNQFTAVPSSLSRLQQMWGLGLSDNRLTGSIPSWLRSLTRLEGLGLSGNQLTGSIPSWLGSLPNLQRLVLADNRLTGSIPSSLRDLGNLERLDLAGNRLTGSIPSGLGRLTNLKLLFLHENDLSGSIPSSLGDLTNLENVLLRGNRLTGSIPSALCKFVGINPQQGGVTLPCAGSASALAVSVVPSEGRLVVLWTVPVGSDGETDNHDVRYRAGAEAWIELPDGQNTAGKATINGLTNGTAYEVQVRPGEGTWSASVTGTPSPSVERLSFGNARIEDQHYEQYTAIAPLALPAAGGAAGVVIYALSPALPAGFVFDAVSRTLSGRPTVATSPRTYTYTATDGGSREQVSLSFTIEVEAFVEEAALRRDSLAAQGRALLSSVTDVIGERFRPHATADPDDTGQAPSAVGSAASMLDSWVGRGRVWAPGGEALRSGPPWRSKGAAEAEQDGSLVPDSVGWAGLLWGRSFAASSAADEDGGGASGYTLWGAADRQSFSGTPEMGNYSGNVRSVYVGADRRFGDDWLAGAAVARSWGAADYTPSFDGSATGELATRLSSLYPYVHGKVSRGLTLWAIGGYGRGEAEDASGADAAGEPGELTMTMGAAGLRQELMEQGGVALAVVGGAGSLSLSSSGGGLTVSDLSAGVRRARLAVEASRTSGAVTPFVQLGGRYDGGDGATGTGVELVAGLRASTPRVDVEARGRWLAVHTAAEYGEHGAMARLAVKSRPDGTGLRALLVPRWGAADALSVGEGGALGGGAVSSPRPGALWTPKAQALSLDSELSYGWRLRRLPGVLSSLTSHSRSGFGRDLTRVGFSYLSPERTTGGGVRMEFTLGRERWFDQRVGYQLKLNVSRTF